MGEMFLKKILDKDFEAVTVDELKVIVAHDNIFPISKKDKKALEKIIENGSTDDNRDKMVAVLKEGLPNSFAILSNLDKYGLAAKGFKYQAYPVEFWDLYGEKGLPIRVTISEMGPQLLSKILNLSEAQEGVLNIVFRVADDENLLLIDLKDLKSMINHVSDNAELYESQYGAVAKKSATTLLRSILTLEDQGGDLFFGEPALELSDFMQCNDEGKGMINVLDSVKLSTAPELYSTFLLWMISELYETMPEVGDLDKPKFVFFFDEAHLLFDDMSPAFQKKVEQIIRLIRSKGIGVYFITQSPSDIPDTVLSQLGNRVQHALHAYTPKDQKAVKVAAETFRPNPEFETASVISELGIGEALVSVLDEKDALSIAEIVKKYGDPYLCPIKKIDQYAFVDFVIIPFLYSF